MKAVVAAFNQEKALVGAFSVITNLRMELFQALLDTGHTPSSQDSCFRITSATATLSLPTPRSPVHVHDCDSACASIVVPVAGAGERLRCGVRNCGQSADS